MRSWRRFYRRNRTLITSAIIFAASLGLIGRIPLMPDAQSLYTPLSSVSSFVLSPAAGGALLFHQRNRRAIWWYGVAMLAGVTAPMLYGYFHNETANFHIPQSIGDFVATISSFAPTLLFVGGALLGFWLACRSRRRRWR